MKHFCVITTTFSFHRECYFFHHSGPWSEIVVTFAARWALLECTDGLNSLWSERLLAFQVKDVSMQSCCFWKTLLIPLWDPECFYLCVYAASFWLGERAARHKVGTNLDPFHKHTCFSYTATVVWIERWTCNSEVTCGFESRLRLELSTSEVRPLSKAPNPRTAPRALQCRLPTAPSVCALGWVKCRENISLQVILCIIVYVTNKAQIFLHAPFRISLVSEDPLRCVTSKYGGVLLVGCLCVSHQYMSWFGSPSYGNHVWAHAKMNYWLT